MARKANERGKVIMDVNPEKLGKADTMFMDFFTLYGKTAVQKNKK